MRSTKITDRSGHMIEFVRQKLEIVDLNSQNLVKIKRVVRTESEKFRQKWNKKGRRYDNFTKSYEWLNEEINFGIESINTKSDTTLGRPQKCFDDSSSRTKHRKVKSLLKTFSSSELSFAAAASVRASGKRNSAKLIQKIVTSSLKSISKYKKN